MSTFLFGMPSLIEFGDLQQQVAACRQLGLRFIELNLDCPQYLPERVSSDQLRNITEQTGIGFTVHLPENLDLGMFCTPVREGYRSFCRTVIEWASQAGISLINLHFNSGVHFSMPSKKVWLYEQYRQEHRNNLEASFRPLLQLADECGVALSIENTGNYGLPHVTDALQELIDVGEGSLKLTWDVGHDAAAKYADRPFLLAHKSSIAHMHLHDANDKGSHLPLGEGIVPVKEVVAFARDAGIGVVLETKTFSGLQMSVDRLGRYIDR